MMGAQLIKENDIVVTETGTFNFGVLGRALPKGSASITQLLYASIGWASASTLGALLAAEEASTPRRTILFTGDGSIQLTIQEVATVVRLSLKPILVVDGVPPGHLLARSAAGTKLYSASSAAAPQPARAVPGPSQLVYPP
ncbi:hypothetical protein JCM8208_006025 [Rhodotorula glutinis]